MNINPYRIVYLFVLVFFSTLSVHAAKPLNVITTTTDLRAITEAIGKDHVRVISICSGGQDPHFIEAKPSYMIKMKKADLFIRIGLQLEIGWEPLLLKGARNSKIQVGSNGFLEASQGIFRLEVPSGPVDRSMGDIHSEGNPHYWLDPFNARIISQTIADRLSLLKPVHADEFRKNQKDFVQSLDAAMFGLEILKLVPPDTLWELHAKGILSQEIFARFHGKDLIGGWAHQMEPVRGVDIITYHTSWSYFLNRFRINAIAQVEPKPGINPSPRHILRLIQLIQNQTIKIILMEPYYSEKAPMLIAQKTGISILKLSNSVGGASGTGNYILLMDNIINKISAHFSR